MVGNWLGGSRAYLHFYQIVCCFLKVWKNYAFVRLSDVLRKNADQVLQAPIRKVAKKNFDTSKNTRGWLVGGTIIRVGVLKTFWQFSIYFFLFHNWTQ